MGFEALCLTWTAPAAEPAHPQPLTASVRPPRPGSASQGPCPNKKVRFGIRGFLVLGMDSDGVRSVAGRSFSGPNGFCGRNFRACVDKRSRRGFGGSRSLTGAGYSKLTGPSGDRTISVIESPPPGMHFPKGREASNDSSLLCFYSTNILEPPGLPGSPGPLHAPSRCGLVPSVPSNSAGA